MDLDKIKKTSNGKEWLPFVFLGLVILGSWIFARNQADSPRSGELCMMRRLTLQEFRAMAESEGLNPTQEDLDYFNKKPLCREVCLEQKRYSETYADWYADEDLRAICEGVGIDLPE